MGENFYNNNQEKYSEVINSLKELPQIKAAADFEYNLMTKIQNQNFELSSSELQKSNRWVYWTFGPVLALGLSAVILFFVLIPSESVEENPLLSLPKAIAEESPEIYVDTDIDEAVVPPAPALNSGLAEMNLPAESSYRTIIKPNDVVIKEKITYPFNESRSINLDDYVGDTRVRSSNTGPIMSVGGGTNSFNFNGFYIPLRQGSKEWQIMKNRMDSLKLKAKESDLQ